MGNRCDDTHCNILQHAATYYKTVQHTETHSGKRMGWCTPQRTATRCNLPHHTATHWNTLWETGGMIHTATYCNTLQPTTPQCNILKHTLWHRWDDGTSRALEVTSAWKTRTHTHTNAKDAYAHTCTYTHAHTHTHRHTYTHTRQTRTHSRTHTHILAYTYTQFGQIFCVLNTRGKFDAKGCVAVCFSVLQRVVVCFNDLACNKQELNTWSPK